jgi:hypothetical protein
MFRLCTKTVTQVRVIVARPPDSLRILYLDLNLGAKRRFSIPMPSSLCKAVMFESA